jgi:hypothetical protein
MELGALATIGVQRPQNLSIAVFDSGRYGETGMQASHTDAAVSLPAVACACGIEQAFDITNEPALRAFSTLMHSARATLFARVAITADGTPRVLPPRDGALLKTRFSPRHWC